MLFEDILQHRRSVRIYDAAQKLDTDKVRKCIELATLAPNSSNMQLWEFYHITDAEVLKKLAPAVLNQTAVTTAQELVIFVIRKDKYKERAKAILAFEKGNIERNSPAERQERRYKDRQLYYGKLMPMLYARFFGLLGFGRKLLVSTVALFRPMVREVSENDMRVVMHKTCALAAQTFMLGMANEGYDTCPLEGFDSRRVKKIIGAPCAAEITMIVSCGIRKGNEGIWGERFRVPFNEVYKKI